jgi:hypothetical protein
VIEIGGMFEEEPDNDEKDWLFLMNKIIRRMSLKL